MRLDRNDLNNQSVCSEDLNEECLLNKTSLDREWSEKC